MKQNISIDELEPGDNLTWEEFEKRYDAKPCQHRAELIGGVVYIPWMTLDHASIHGGVAVLTFHYHMRTKGCRAGGPSTWRMFDDAPQPDQHIRILPEYGGQSTIVGDYGSGAPELIIEVCHSSVAYDLHQKKDLYHRAGVKEYLAVLLHEKKVLWFIWNEDGFRTLNADKKGIMRSRIFPGLWLNVPALFKDDTDALLETMEAGLSSKEHAEFAAKLAVAKKN